MKQWPYMTMAASNVFDDNALADDLLPEQLTNLWDMGNEQNWLFCPEGIDPDSWIDLTEFLQVILLDPPSQEISFEDNSSSGSPGYPPVITKTLLNDEIINKQKEEQLPHAILEEADCHRTPINLKKYCIVNNIETQQNSPTLNSTGQSSNLPPTHEMLEAESPEPECLNQSQNWYDASTISKSNITADNAINYNFNFSICDNSRSFLENVLPPPAYYYDLSISSGSISYGKNSTMSNGSISIILDKKNSIPLTPVSSRAKIVSISATKLNFAESPKGSDEGGSLDSITSSSDNVIVKNEYSVTINRSLVIDPCLEQILMAHGTPKKLGILDASFTLNSDTEFLFDLLNDPKLTSSPIHRPYHQTPKLRETRNKSEDGNASFSIRINNNIHKQIARTPGQPSVLNKTLVNDENIEERHSPAMLEEAVCHRTRVNNSTGQTSNELHNKTVNLTIEFLEESSGKLTNTPIKTPNKSSLNRTFSASDGNLSSDKNIVHSSPLNTNGKRELTCIQLAVSTASIDKTMYTSQVNISKVVNTVFNSSIAPTTRTRSFSKIPMPTRRRF